MTVNNNKVRSLALTAMLVLSVFAGTMAFAGSAVAAFRRTPTLRLAPLSTQGAAARNSVCGQ